MTAMDVDSPSLASQLTEAANVLILVPAMDARENEACTQFLSAVPPDEANVLFVTFTQSPDDRFQVWKTHAGTDWPANSSIIDVGGMARSAAVEAVNGFEPGGGTFPISTVSSPGDLTSLGIRLSEYLSTWAGNGNQTVVCFHSLTSLLQYADLQRTFRFLHVLTSRVRSVDAAAHYHMDPSAHDERTLNTLRTLFDGIVSVNEDGSWDVSSR